jgi:hypothetical protein
MGLLDNRGWGQGPVRLWRIGVKGLGITKNKRFGKMIDSKIICFENIREMILP